MVVEVVGSIVGYRWVAQWLCRRYSLERIACQKKETHPIKNCQRVAAAGVDWAYAGVIDSVHLSMHAHGLARPILLIASIIVRTVVIVTRGDDLAPLDEDATQSKKHLRLRCSLGALANDQNALS